MSRLPDVQMSRSTRIAFSPGHDTGVDLWRKALTEDHTIAAAYLDEVCRSFRGYKRLTEGAFAQLQDADFFYTPDPESNSVALLVKHLSGNMRSRFTDFLTTDGEKTDRHRDREFEMETAVTREQWMRWWEAAWTCAFQPLRTSQPEDRPRPIH